MRPLAYGAVIAAVMVGGLGPAWAVPPAPPTGLAAAIGAALRGGREAIVRRFAIDEVCRAGEFARATIEALDVITDPADVWLKQDRAGWRVIAGPTTSIEEEELARLGVPKGLSYDGHAPCVDYTHATANFPIEGRYVVEDLAATVDVRALSKSRVRVYGLAAAPPHHIGEVCQEVELRWSSGGTPAAWVTASGAAGLTCSLWINFLPEALVVKQITPHCEGRNVTFAGTYRRESPKYRGQPQCPTP